MPVQLCKPQSSEVISIVNLLTCKQLISKNDTWKLTFKCYQLHVFLVHMELFSTTFEGSVLINGSILMVRELFYALF